jgi:HEAT repeat protein
MVTMKDVRRAIDPEEPNYREAARRIGTDGLPYLAELAQGEDTMIASKAVSLAGRIGGQKALPIIDGAAQADAPEVRITAASAAGRLGLRGEEVLADLLTDNDPGVRRYALDAVSTEPSAALKRRLEKRRDEEKVPGIREKIEEKLDTLRRPG